MEEKTIYNLEIKLLAEEILNKRLVIFVGAGVSASAGLPLWKDLLQQLQEEYNVKTKINDLTKIASMLEKKLGKVKFRQGLVKQLQSIEYENKPSNLINNIIKLDVNLFITTNYDHLLENAFSRNKMEPQIIYKDNDLPSRVPTKKCIVKLHGDINNPSEIIIKTSDYIRYKKEHKPFIDWYNSILSQNTVLFIGTSFDDSRLLEADDYVINSFGENRLKPYIILKKPTKDKEENDEEYEIELSDFESIVTDFRNRNFFVIVIDEYEEIEEILQRIHIEYLKLKRKSDHHNNYAESYSYELEDKLKKFVNDRVIELCNKVKGEGCLPTFNEQLNRLEELLRFLDFPSSETLSSESYFELYFTIIEVYLRNYNNYYLLIDDYFKKLQNVYDKIEDKNVWQHKYDYLYANILFHKGNIIEAIKHLENTANNKLRALWLGFLIETDKIDAAKEFVKNNTISDEWIFEALYIYNVTGDLKIAEDIFNNAVKDFIDKDDMKLKNTSCINNIFIQKIAYSMISGILNYASNKISKNKLDINVKDINEETSNLLQKALSYEKYIIENKDLKNNYISYLAYVDIFIINWLLKDFNKTDVLAKELIKVRPVKTNLLSYIIVRIKYFSDEEIKLLKNCLIEDYNEKSWIYKFFSDIDIRKNNLLNAWEHILKAISLPFSEEEKEGLAESVIELSHYLNKDDEAIPLLNKIYSENENVIKYFDAISIYRRDEKEEAKKLFIELQQKDLPKVFLLKIKLLLSDYEIAAENWIEAKRLIKESINIYENPLNLHYLLSVQTKLKDNIGTLKTIEKLECFSIENDELNTIKAHALRNLGRFEEADEVWKSLCDRNPNNYIYHYHYSQLLFFQNKFENAFGILRKFIEPDEFFNPICLEVACRIKYVQEKLTEAYDLLEKCETQIQEEPNLLLLFQDLAYKTGHEKKANKILTQLINLQKSGKISDNLIKKMNIEETIAMLKEDCKVKKEYNENYIYCKYFRFILVIFNNMSYYMDWRSRTQEILLSKNIEEWVNFTVYSTNKYYVDEKKLALVSLSVPDNINEIIIDISALITLHRLGLFEKISKRFKKIYYPLLLKNILYTENKYYIFQQKSREKIFIELHKKIEYGIIKVIESPDSSNNIKNKVINLAIMEKVPILSLSINKNDLPIDSNVLIIRFKQLVQWLYRKGQVSEAEYFKYQKFDEAEPIITNNIDNILDETTRIIVDGILIETLEDNKYIDLLKNIGITIVLEKLNAFNYTNYSVVKNFNHEVKEWQTDLINKLDKYFEPFQIEISSKNINDLYYHSYMMTFNYAKNNNLKILTDDRVLQKYKISDTPGVQFGTDVLIEDLYEKNIISIEEYSKSYLQLIKWRYRFLIPPLDILMYFAKEYKNNLPGKDIETIMKYCHDCLNDPGLPPIYEAGTNPPMSIGIYFFSDWFILIISFLKKVCIDDDFNLDSLEKLTKALYNIYLPTPPKNIKSDIRNIYMQISENNVMPVLLDILLLNIINSKKEKVKRLFELTIKHFNITDDILDDIIINQIKFLEFDFKNDNNKQLILNRFLYNISDIVFDNNNIPESLIPYLHDIIDKNSLKKAENNQRNMDKIINAYISKKEKNIQTELDLPDYNMYSPIKRFPYDEGKEIVATDYELITSTNENLRLKIINALLKFSCLTEYTKKIIENFKNDILNNNYYIWNNAAQKIKPLVLKDIDYLMYFFSESFQIDNNIFFNYREECFKYFFVPDIKSIQDSANKILFDSDFNSTFIYNTIIEKLSALINIDGKSTNIFEKFLNLYYENIYFIPFDYPNNCWNIMSKVIRTGENQFSLQEKVILLKKWVEDKNDVFAYLIVIELTLIFRSQSTGEEKKYFTSNEFYNFLDNILKSLIFYDTTVYNENNNISQFWQMKKLLVEYFIIYFDLNKDEYFKEYSDDKLIALAWWTAHKYFITISKTINNYDDKNRKYLVKQFIEFIQSKLYDIKFRHISFEKNIKYSVFRYQSFEGSNIISTAVLSLLSPEKKYDDFNDQKPFKGMIEPATALNLNIRDFMINIIALSLSDIKILDYTSDNEIPLLWNNSYSKLVENFLKAYYKDAFVYLGKEKIKIINTYNNIISFFSNQDVFSYYSNYNDCNADYYFIIISILKSYVFFENTLPDNFDGFKNKIDILNEICSKDKPNLLKVSYVIDIMKRLYIVNNFKDAEKIKLLFTQIDYNNCQEEISKFLIRNLIYIYTICGDYSIIDNFLKYKNKNKIIRNTLSEIKEHLQDSMSIMSPGIYKENIRNLLKEISNL